MKANEATELLKETLMNTRKVDEMQSKAFKSMTMAQAIFSASRWLEEYPDDYELSPLMEKRVKQVCQNRMRPT